MSCQSPMVDIENAKIKPSAVFLCCATIAQTKPDMNEKIKHAKIAIWKCMDKMYCSLNFSIVVSAVISADVEAKVYELIRLAVNEPE